MATRASTIKPSEIVIEINHSRIKRDFDGSEAVLGNNELYFYPTGTTLRSKIIPSRSGHGLKGQWVSIQSIPGQRVHVDPKNLKARITDALNDDENSRILEQVKKACAAGNRQISGGMPEEKFDLQNAEELHNWLYWMRRAVDDGHADIVQGEGQLPSCQALIDEGDIRHIGPADAVHFEHGSPYRKGKAKAAVPA